MKEKYTQFLLQKHLDKTVNARFACFIASLKMIIRLLSWAGADGTDSRIDTNKKGFCAGHFEQLYNRQEIAWVWLLKRIPI